MHSKKQNESKNKGIQKPYPRLSHQPLPSSTEDYQALTTGSKNAKIICRYAHILLRTEGITIQDLIKAAKALSDETRLRILNIILERECCVCEVMQTLDISQSRASRNLGILNDVGFLKARRDGAWVVYAIDWSMSNRYTATLARLVEDSRVSNEILAQDRERLSHAARVGQGCLKK